MGPFIHLDFRPMSASMLLLSGLRNFRRFFTILVLGWLGCAAARLSAAPFAVKLTPAADGLSAELSHPGRLGARYVVEEAPSLAGPWSSVLSYYGTAANLPDGYGRLQVPLPPPVVSNAGSPAPAPTPAEAEYEFWLGVTPEGQWRATLYQRRELGGRYWWHPVRKNLAAGKDWAFSNITRPGGTKGLPWISRWEIPAPSGGKWVFQLDRFLGLTGVAESPELTPEETTAFQRLESSWQTIANQLAATPPAPPGVPVESGPKRFLRVREELVDSDGDGILDVVELAGANPTDPFKADSDGDGAMDGETPADQDPLKKDTDKDGLPDVEDAVVYDPKILWPRLNLQYAWAPLTGADAGWLPLLLNNNGDVLCVKPEDTAGGYKRWLAAMLQDGRVSSTQVVFNDTKPSANTTTDIRYELLPLAMTDGGTVLFGEGKVWFPNKHWDFGTGALKTESAQVSARMNAWWVRTADKLQLVLPPDQQYPETDMTGRLSSTRLGSSPTQNNLLLSVSHAGLMDGAGRLYSGVRDGLEWPFQAASNFTGTTNGANTGNNQRRTAWGSGFVWASPDGLGYLPPDGSTPVLGAWRLTSATSGDSYAMRSYDAVSRAGKAIWRSRTVNYPWNAKDFHAATGVIHTIGTIGGTASVPKAVPLADTPALPVPTVSPGIDGNNWARSYLAIADMPEPPPEIRDSLTGDVLPRSSGPLIFSRAWETLVRRWNYDPPAAAGENGSWMPLPLKKGRSLGTIEWNFPYEPTYYAHMLPMRVSGSTGTFLASSLGQVLNNGSYLWQNGESKLLSSLCQPQNIADALGTTKQLKLIWTAEINDAGLIAGEAWYKTGKSSPDPDAAFGEGGLAVPYEFDMPGTLEIGGENWASLSLPEKLISGRDVRLSWWKKSATGSTWTDMSGGKPAKIRMEGGLMAFPVRTATNAASPWDAADDIPGATPGEIWQARIGIPVRDGSDTIWFTCLGPELTIVPGQPAKIEVVTPPPTGTTAWVADNRSEFPVTVRVTDKKGNRVADGTVVSFDLYGTASTRPVVGSEAPVKEGETPDPRQRDFLTSNGVVSLTFRTFLSIHGTAYISSGTVKKELSIDYRGVQGSLTSAKTALNTNGTGGETTATLKLTTPVKNGTPVVWTVSRYTPGGISRSQTLENDDLANFTVKGFITAQEASIPILATGAATGNCIVTATVAEKLFVHTIQFKGNVSFSAGLDRELLVADLAYEASAGRDYQRSAAEFGGSSQVYGFSKAAIGSIQGVPGHTYQVRFQDPNGSSGLRLSAGSSSALLNPSDSLNVTANASGLAQFWVKSSGQLSVKGVECVRIEVRDTAAPATEASILQVGAALDQIAVCMTDAWNGFTGLGDTSGSYTGTIANIIGGACSVNDIGALVKNGARAAGLTEGRVDKLEAGLAGLGAAATLASWTGVGLAPKFVIQTLKAIKSTAPKLAALLWNAFKDSLIEGKAMVGEFILKKCAVHILEPTGSKGIKFLEETFTSEGGIKALDRLSRDLGADRAEWLVKAAANAVNDATADRLIGKKVMWILDSLDDDAKYALRTLKNEDEAAAIATGLAKLLDAASSEIKSLDEAMLRRALNNKYLFQSPNLLVRSSYTQMDLLKDLAKVATQAKKDPEGVLRLVHALKAENKSTFGNRYALSVIADRVEHGGDEAIEFLNKWFPKVGVKGAAEFDAMCKVGGVLKIREIKASKGAFRSEKQLMASLTKIDARWDDALLAKKVEGLRPEIIYTSPLPKEDLPKWLQSILDDPVKKKSLNIKYEQGIPFK